MGNRRERTIRIACVVLGAVLALQLAVLVVHASFSRGLAIPALPSLPPEADGAKNTNSPAGTNSAQGGTNAPGTNVAPKNATNSVSTNVAASSANAKTNGPFGEGRSTSQSKLETNVAAAASKTNGAPVSERAMPADTNISAVLKIASTNGRTNIVATATNRASTNSASSKTASKKSGPGGRPGAPTKMAELPPQAKERVDRIVQGEMLAPVMRPMPMALLGIGGQSAMLRSPDGQTGVVKEGDTLGSIKLVRIGTNRVLIEQEGEKKELTIFDGLGSETLLPKPDKTTNEPAKKIH